jgi:transcriptional regulator with XRE-family HTH domain
MILKQLRLSRSLSQEQLADMSGLNVRTIQRIESGQKASVESLKCIAAALGVDILTLTQETFVIDKHSPQWQSLPLWVKLCFYLDFANGRPPRTAVIRGEIICHVSGFLFRLYALWSSMNGLQSHAALQGGLTMLFCAYCFRLSIWQNDRYGLWFDKRPAPSPA